MHRARDRDPSGEVGFSHFVRVFWREIGASERVLRQLKLVLPNARWKFPPATSLSLLVVFHYLGRPHMRLIWITSGVPQSLTLPQQIPALI